MTDDELLAEIEDQRDLMISVATDGPRINTVNAEYQERRRRLSSALSARGLEDPNPHGDLWSWYGKWSSGDLPTWQSRREYINGLYQPLLDRLAAAEDTPEASSSIEPTGWTRVDRVVVKAREQLAAARNEEDFQAIGLICREALISLAQAVYDPTLHISIDGTAPSDTDAKRMLEAYIGRELAGGSNETLRKHAKAALDVANALQHKRTATFRDAALCIEATASVMNIIAVISGIRDPGVQERSKLRLQAPATTHPSAQQTSQHPSSAAEKIDTRTDRILEIQNVKMSFTGQFVRTVNDEKVKFWLPIRQGNFRLYLLLSGNNIDGYWYVSIRKHPLLDLENELADVRVLMQQCVRSQVTTTCKFIIVTDADVRLHRVAIRRAFAKMKEFLPEDQRDLFTFELWDLDVLLEKERELGIRVNVDF